MNNISLVGNITAQPELRFSQEGKPRTSFTVAVNEGPKDNEITHFVRVTAFDSLAENLVDSLTKGLRVLVIGRLNTYRREVTLEGGETKAFTETSFTANAVGPDLRWARARVAKVDRSPSSGDEEAAPEPAAKASSNGSGDDEFADETPAPKAATKKAKPAPAPVATVDDDGEEDF